MRDTQYKYQIAKDKIKDIVSEMADGAPLPNRNLLAQQCGVARITVERAISELVGEGVLVSRDGLGTFRAPVKTDAENDSSGKANKIWALLGYSVTVGIMPFILRGIEDYANDHNISLIVCNTDNDVQKESTYLKRLVEQNISGIILIPNVNSMPDQEAFQAIRKKNIPMVACSRQVIGEDLPGAFQNFFYAAFMATQHLLSVSCRNIAYFASGNYYSVEDRMQGFLAALSQHNSVNPSDTVSYHVLHEKNEEGFEEKIAELLTEHPETDGILLGSDRLVLPLYNVMKKRGLTPGKEIRIISSEDSGFCRCFWVPLSSVSIPYYEMGKITAEQLYLLQNGENEKNLRREIISGEVIQRESSTGSIA